MFSSPRPAHEHLFLDFSYTMKMTLRSVGCNYFTLLKRIYKKKPWAITCHLLPISPLLLSTQVVFPLSLSTVSFPLFLFIYHRLQLYFTVEVYLRLSKLFCGRSRVEVYMLFFFRLTVSVIVEAHLFICSFVLWFSGHGSVKLSLKLWFILSLFPLPLAIFHKPSTTSQQPSYKKPLISPL